MAKLADFTVAPVHGRRSRDRATMSPEGKATALALVRRAIAQLKADSQDRNA